MLTEFRFCGIEVEGGEIIDGSGVGVSSVLPLRNGGVEFSVKGDEAA
jgi:hypothetical protein